MGGAGLTPVVGRAPQAWNRLCSGSWGSSSTKPLTSYLQSQEYSFDGDVKISVLKHRLHFNSVGAILIINISFIAGDNNNDHE